MNQVSQIIAAATRRVPSHRYPRQDQHECIVLFEVSLDKFPWRVPIPRQIEERRARLSDVLIFDILLLAGGVKHPDALYPPRDVGSLNRLLEAIEDTTYDALKKDCLIYFLLKWHQDGREDRFRDDRCIPPQFVALADAYWNLDSGTDVPVRPTSYQVLQNSF
jgi:hypothetical protein